MVESLSEQIPVIVQGERHKIDPERWQKALDRQMQIACGEDDEAQPKDITAAFKAILAAEAQNQNDEQHSDIRMDEGRNRILELLERSGADAGSFISEQGRKAISDGGSFGAPEAGGEGKERRRDAGDDSSEKRRKPSQKAGGRFNRRNSKFDAGRKKKKG